MVPDGSTPVLTSKKGREGWEKAVNTHFIQPVLENLDVEVNTAMNRIANDDKQSKYYVCVYMLAFSQSTLVLVHSQ